MISFIDIAPTLLEIAGIDHAESGMKPFQGRSLTGLLADPSAERNGDDYILIGKERHDVGRPDDQAYPVRGIIKDNYLYLINFKPDRWPSGDPVTGYLNTDASPTKSLILELRRQRINQNYWSLSFGLRPDEELYNIKDDPHCIVNLASDKDLEKLRKEMRTKLLTELESQGDPRVTGNGDVFDKYVYADKRTRDFYKRFMDGELDSTSAGWVRPSDFETGIFRD
jgi:arylsulfatase A-like enzyme